MKNKNLGYDKSNLVVCSMNKAVKKNYHTLKTQLLENSNILNVTASLNLPTWSQPSVKLSQWEGKENDEELTMYHGYVDYDYFTTFGIKLTQGRAFSKNFPTDITSALIANQEAVRRMGMEDPLGKQVNMFERPNGVIIGVMEDFHYSTLHDEIGPMILVLDPTQTDYLIIKINPDEVLESVEYIREKWNIFDPDNSFYYQFLADRLDRSYLQDKMLSRVINYAAYLSLFISCLGLLGLATFSAEQRTKEIGIRKVLGASGGNIFVLQSVEFLKLLIVSNFFAWPLGYFIMKSFR